MKQMNRWMGVVAGSACVFAALAFPPAPPHEIYGMARHAAGQPIMDPAVEMVFMTDAGTVVQGVIAPGLEAGINYYVTVPMDAGLTPVPYLDNALEPLVPFKISVVIAGVTNLPIEMTGDYYQLGLSGESTRIDLTLGEDSDGDGLPDLWEELIIYILNDGSTLEDIDPDGDADGDGMKNIDEYYAGTYAFDDQDLFELYPRQGDADNARFAFLAIQGHSYEIQASSNLTSWTAIPFSVPSQPGQEDIGFYTSYATEVTEVEVAATNAAAFYRGVVK